MHSITIKTSEFKISIFGKYKLISKIDIFITFDSLGNFWKAEKVDGQNLYAVNMAKDQAEFPIVSI